MARRGHAYPQVDVRASGLINMRVLACPEGASAAVALALLRKRSGQALALPGGKGIVLVEDLTRAVALGLSELPAADLRRDVAVVPGSAPEVSVRRRLFAGAPAVLVGERRETMGAVNHAALRAVATGGMSLLARLSSRMSPETLGLLSELGRLAEALGSRAFAVGGAVRDALADDPPHARRPVRHDIDVVIEGNGVGVARRAAQTLGGTLTVHAAFGTASIEGLAPCRLDIVTARAERYAAPGALPTVRPGTIVDDQKRRDFSVNALAVELGSGAFGLLDPLGGRQDVIRRRIRVLHPLSFVEDPTRIFRAVRYAARLDFALDRATLRAHALAFRLAPYRALSAHRIAAEIERLLDDTTPGATLARLGELGAFRLLDRRFQFSRLSAGPLQRLPEAIDWIRRHVLTATPLELAALAIVAEQLPDVRASALRGLGFSGERLARLLRAHESVPALLERLAEMSAAPASRRAALLRERPAIDVAWAWLTAGSAARAQLDWYLASASGARGELRGEDLVGLGIPRGPAVGLALRRLRDARLDGSVRSRDDEVALVREWTDEAQAASTTREERR